MIKILKKYWYLFSLCIVLDTFLIITCTIKTDIDIITPGGLNEVSSIIEVDNDFKQKGSMNTIYVYSLEKVTLMQSFLAGRSSITNKSQRNMTFDLTNEENRLSGIIEKEQSIEASLICAYETANKKDSKIKISYDFLGFIIYLKQRKQIKLKIGDLIYAVKKSDNYIDNSDSSLLTKALNSLAIGDILYVKRGMDCFTYQIEEELAYAKENCIYCYQKFNIDAKKTTPSFTLHPANTLGPSGGLLQTLAVFSQITESDFTNGLKVAGTGTISTNGKVGEIGGIKQKVYTALKNNADIFICPESQYTEAYEAFVKKGGKSKMKLIKASNFIQLIESLGALYGF